MVFFGLFALAIVLVFFYRVYREPRRIGNAVWLGIAVLFSGMWLLAQMSGIRWLQVAVFALLVLIVALTVFVLPWALIANGVVMWRREGHRLANLLSLLAGLAMIGLFGVTFAAVVLSRARWLVAVSASSLVVAGYVAFLFTALLGYSVLYSRLGGRARADAVIVLGSGLLGDRVPPLLASRLDRAVQCYRRAVANGADVVLVVSGGKGADELVSEAAAMSGYLRDAGVPPEQILVEDKATTTDENLRYSVDLLAEHGRTGRIVAVTSNYHVFRTAVLARRLRLRMDVIGAKTASYFVPSAFLREFVALLTQHWRVNLAVCVFLAAGPAAIALLPNR